MEQALPQPAPQSSRFVKAIRWILRVVMWMVVLAWLFSYFGAYFYIAELFSNFRLQLLVLIFVALLLSRIAGARKLLTISLLVALAWSCQETFRIYLPADQPPAGQTVVRLMSFNILATNDAYGSVIREINRQDPDVLVVLEYAGNWHDILNTLNHGYPFQHREPRWHGYGIAVFSKIPFQSAQSVPLTRKAIDNPAANVTLEIDNQPVHLTAAHVMSPVTYYRQQLRNEQFQELADIVNSDAGSRSEPRILVGDMNCTTASSYLQELIKSTGLRDSRQGFGIQCSWVEFAPLLNVPIDQVFVSPQLHIHDRFLGDPSNSDHRPVIVDFSVSPQ